MDPLDYLARWWINRPPGGPEPWQNRRFPELTDAERADLNRPIPPTLPPSFTMGEYRMRYEPEHSTRRGLYRLPYLIPTDQLPDPNTRSLADVLRPIDEPTPLMSPVMPVVNPNRFLLQRFMRPRGVNQ